MEEGLESSVKLKVNELSSNDNETTFAFKVLAILTKYATGNLRDFLEERYYCMKFVESTGNSPNNLENSESL